MKQVLTILRRFQLMLAFLSCFISLQQLYSQEIIELWEEGEIPFSKINDLQETEKEAWGTKCVYNITKPTLTVYEAQGENSGKAVMIIPGGGYELVAMYHEGYDLARKLSSQGITSAVLKYRIPDSRSSDQPEEVAITDARKGLEILHNMADELGYNTDKIGIVGFSAGSHLSTLLCLWKSEKANENPDFAGLIYGVTNFSEENQKWLEESLYYRKLTPVEVEKNTLLNLVDVNTCPSFLVHSIDDDVCKLEESTLYADKLYEVGVPFELHFFPNGGHGFGMGRKEDGTDQWVNLFINWVKREF